MQQGNQVFEAHVGNARTFSVQIYDPPVDPTDDGPGTPITGADVYLSVYDEFDVLLPGVTWPVQMTELGAQYPGWYTYVTSSLLQWQHMKAYYAKVEYAGEVMAVPPIVAYDRTLQQPTQAQLRAIALEAGLSI